MPGVAVRMAPSAVLPVTTGGVVSTGGDGRLTGPTGAAEAPVDWESGSVALTTTVTW